jgi:hypothetical protein
MIYANDMSSATHVCQILNTLFLARNRGVKDQIGLPWHLRYKYIIISFSFINASWLPTLA